MIIADENIDQLLIDKLREKEYLVLSIREDFSGISDKEVVNIVKSRKGVLITEDKDFGELVFAHGIDGLSVVFLRYDKREHLSIEHALLKVLDEHIDTSGHFFITITRNKIRITSI